MYLNLSLIPRTKCHGDRLKVVIQIIGVANLGSGSWAEWWVNMIACASSQLKYDSLACSMYFRVVWTPSATSSVSVIGCRSYRMQVTSQPVYLQRVSPSSAIDPTYKYCEKTLSLRISPSYPGLLYFNFIHNSNFSFGLSFRRLLNPRTALPIPTHMQQLRNSLIRDREKRHHEGHRYWRDRSCRWKRAPRLHLKRRNFARVCSDKKTSLERIYNRPESDSDYTWGLPWLPSGSIRATFRRWSLPVVCEKWFKCPFMLNQC